MPAQIITNNALPIGVPGDITRDIRESTVEAVKINAATPAPFYGIPLVWSTPTSLGVRPFAAGDAASALAGYNVRSNPSLGGSLTNQGFGPSTPPLSGIGDMLKKGYMAVRVNGVTTGVAKEGPVYVRVGAATQLKPIGGVEAVSDGANTVQLPLTVFTGPCDAEGNAEIRYNV